MKACAALLFVLFCVCEADPVLHLKLDHHPDQGTELELTLDNHDDHGTANTEDSGSGGLTENGAIWFSCTGHKTWEDSRAECQAKGADLIVVNTTQKELRLGRIVPFNTPVWIGLSGSPLSINGSIVLIYQWVNGQLLTSPTYWQPGEPRYPCVYYVAELLGWNAGWKTTLCNAKLGCVCIKN